MAFKSRELMFGFSIERDTDDPDDPDHYVVLRLEGCKDSKVFVSCGGTQNPLKTQQTNPNIICDKCVKEKDGRIQVTGSEGLRSLRQSLKEMLKKLGPAEKELRAFEKAEAKKASAYGKGAAKASAKKPTKTPAKKAAKPAAKKR